MRTRIKKGVPGVDRACATIEVLQPFRLRLFLFLVLDINTKRDGFSHSTLQPKRKSPNVFLSARYRVTRASMVWYGMVWW